MILIPTLIPVTPPTVEPVKLGDMFTQLGMANVEDAALETSLVAQLNGYITAARLYCEKHEKRAYAPQTWKVTYDRFPHSSRSYSDSRHALVLPLAPFVEVTSFQYVNQAGTLVDLPLDETYGADPNLPAFAYQVLQGGDTQQARLLPAYSRWWPPVRPVPGAVQITFNCGYAAAAVPGSVLQAIKFLAQFYFEQGGVTDQPVPQVVHGLLSPPCRG